MPYISITKPSITALLCAFTFGGAAVAQTTATPPPAVTPPPVPPPVVTPPPLPPVPQISVFVVQNGTQAGPFGAAQLADLAKSGALKPDTLVWQEGMAAWAAANTVPELASILADNVAAADPVAFLTGSWSGSANGIPIPGLGTGSITITAIYNADLSASAFGTIIANSTSGTIPINITMEGTYKAQQLDATTILVTPNVRITYAAAGMNPETSMDITPAAITILSPNSYQDSEGIIYTRR